MTSPWPILEIRIEVVTWRQYLEPLILSSVLLETLDKESLERKIKGIELVGEEISLPVFVCDMVVDIEKPKGSIETKK